MNTSHHQLIEVGPVIGLAVRPGKDEPMVVVEQVSATAAQGVVEDYGQSLKRGITFISSMQWQQVQDELGAELGKTIKCPHCLEEHDIKNGTSKDPITGEQVPSNILQFYKCGDTTYLAGIKGKRVR